MALAEYGNAFNIDTDGSGNPILIDPQSGDTIAVYDRGTGSWQVTTIEAATGDFNSVNTINADIDLPSFGRYGRYATYIVTHGGDGYLAFNQSGEDEFEDAELHNVLQSIFDNTTRQPHIHLPAGRFYNYTDTTVADKPFLLSGSGRNRTQIRQEDGTNANFMRLDSGDGTPGFITSFWGLKFVGNNANNSSGSALVNVTHKEIQMMWCEFRDWPKYGFEQSVTVDDAHYNFVKSTWFLENTAGGIVFQNNTGTTLEWEFEGCKLQGSSNNNPAIFVRNGSGLKNLSIQGGFARYDNPIQIEEPLESLNIDGTTFYDLRGIYGIGLDYDLASPTQLDIEISDCQFNTDAAQPADYHILARDNWQNIRVKDCRFSGPLDDGPEIKYAGSGQDIERQGLKPYTVNALDAAPLNPSTGREALASSTWDPDSDGNGEKVIYDGTAWQEVADMPNF